MPCRNGFLLLAFNLFYSVRGRFITTSLLLKNCYSEIPLPPSSLWLPTLIGSIGSIFLCRARRNAKDNNHHMAPRDWLLSCVYGSLPNKTSPIIFRNNSWNEVYWTLTFNLFDVVAGTTVVKGQCLSFRLEKRGQIHHVPVDQSPSNIIQSVSNEGTFQWLFLNTESPQHWHTSGGCGVN